MLIAGISNATLLTILIVIAIACGVVWLFKNLR